MVSDQSEREKKDNLFKAASDLVEHVDVNYEGKSADSDDHQPGHEADDSVLTRLDNSKDYKDAPEKHDESDNFEAVTEIESLCMKCQKNVRHL